MARFVKQCKMCKEYISERGPDLCDTCGRDGEVVSNFNALAAKIYEENRKWFVDVMTGEPIERNKGELMMLMVTELAESFEGIRKDLMDDHLPHRKMEEVELADLFIRVLVYAAHFELDLDGAFREKLVYNRTRKDHQPEARTAEGGKKF